MKDTSVHYTYAPFLPEGIALAFMQKTSATMCGKRRSVSYVTFDLRDVTCTLCRGCALEYHTRERDQCANLIRYAESDALRGTSAEREAADLVAKLFEAMATHDDMLALLR